MYVGLPGLADPGSWSSVQPWSLTLGAETTAKVGLCDTRFKFWFRPAVSALHNQQHHIQQVTSLGVQDQDICDKVRGHT